MCCRKRNGYPDDPAKRAGPYGSLAACDVPVSMLYKLGDKINELKPDVLFWTGDVPPHDQWEYSLEHNKMYSSFLQDYMNANLSDWSTYVIEGNHDFGLVVNS
mmetsp:Transcript_59748/g.82080  ORF Transcript_59748/g.82080 Transcript_59748/m.82080 type:complete len:103 (+) Transcript_59748:706-1014(+)